MNSTPNALLVQRTIDTGLQYTDFLALPDFAAFFLTLLPPAGFGQPVQRAPLSLGTAYQASDPTKPAFITLNLTSTATLSLTTGATNSADVVTGTSNAIATVGGVVTGKYANSLTGSLVVGANIATQSSYTLTLALPIGGWFAVRLTAGNVSITSALEQSVG